MAKTSKIVNDKLEITATGPVTIQTLTKDEVYGKRAEAQTKVDHLQIDLAEAQAEVTEWDVLLEKFDNRRQHGN